MTRDTPLKDDIFFLLSQLYGSGVPFPTRGLVNMIYKHSKRYSDRYSAKAAVIRSITNLKKSGYAKKTTTDFLGLEITGWVLTDKGVQFILAGRRNRASSIAFTERDLVNLSQAPPIKLQTEGDRRDEGY